MKKSINAWSVDKSTSFEEMFAQIKEAGFDGIELNLDNEGNSAHSLYLSATPEDLTKIKALSVKYALPVVSISSSLYGDSMGNPGNSGSVTAMMILMKQLECAAALGATGILVVPGGLSDKVSLKTAWENSAKTLAVLKDDIESMKIFVNVENVWNRFFTSPFDMKAFIDGLDCPYIGAYFDVGNVVEFSEPENWIEILGSRINKVHVKDFKRRSGAYSGGEWVDLLSGSVNWLKVIPALKAAGFDGYLTAEVGKNNTKQKYTEFYATVSAQLNKIIHINEEQLKG